MENVFQNFILFFKTCIILGILELYKKFVRLINLPPLTFLFQLSAFPETFMFVKKLDILNPLKLKIIKTFYFMIIETV